MYINISKYKYICIVYIHIYIYIHIVYIHAYHISHHKGLTCEPPWQSNNLDPD